ncbi:SRPBCC family protein [Bradyrhizobium sp. S69]|uniref:SRPBCC family protein n=1 Tax=Bradyrhizobium sp. S69 TaxID=1641856 RepID=UPI00131B8B77|nr:SRPBCC family protein [Bradyrhizobium sp. S69]
MSKPEFVYVTYIETTPEKLWEALTVGDFTERYWFGLRISSDWEAGSPYIFTRHGAISLEGNVLVSEPCTRLVYTWIPLSPETKHERISRVTFDLEPRGKVIKLIVTHDHLDEGGETRRDISDGWPMVLASLKSFLETGHALEIDPPCAVTREAAYA